MLFFFFQPTTDDHYHTENSRDFPAWESQVGLYPLKVGADWHCRQTTRNGWGEALNRGHFKFHHRYGWWNSVIRPSISDLLPILAYNIWSKLRHRKNRLLLCNIISCPKCCISAVAYRCWSQPGLVSFSISWVMHFFLNLETPNWCPYTTPMDP